MTLKVEGQWDWNKLAIIMAISADCYDWRQTSTLTSKVHGQWD